MIDTLDNLHILITRQQKQSETLGKKIVQLQGRFTVFPLFEIRPVGTRVAIEAAVASALRQDIIIFTSKNSVKYIMPIIKKLKPTVEQLQNRLWASIGPGTAELLTDHGIPAVLYPPVGPYNSERLFQLLQLKSLKNKRISLFTGRERQTQLEIELSKEGAVVEVIEVYQRCKPAFNLQEFDKLISDDLVDIIVVTCETSLQNLLYLSKKLDKVFWSLPLLVISERIYQKAMNLGFSNIILTSSMTDEAILSTLLSWSTEMRSANG